MKTPRPGQIYNRDAYWSAIDADRERSPEGYITQPLRDWSFDFISIHLMASFQGEAPRWNLCSPMILVNDAGERPPFEAISFPTQRDAIAAARTACRNRRPDHLIFIVIVDGQRTAAPAVVEHAEYATA